MLLIKDLGTCQISGLEIQTFLHCLLWKTNKKPRSNQPHTQNPKQQQKQQTNKTPTNLQQLLTMFLSPSCK